MKLRIASLSLLALTLATVPTLAQTVYSNGPITFAINSFDRNLELS
jgi:hypothetical protein